MRLSWRTSVDPPCWWTARSSPAGNQPSNRDDIHRFSVAVKKRWQNTTQVPFIISHIFFFVYFCEWTIKYLCSETYSAHCTEEFRQNADSLWWFYGSLSLVIGAFSSNRTESYVLKTKRATVSVYLRPISDIVLELESIPWSFHHVNTKSALLLRAWEWSLTFIIFYRKSWSVVEIDAPFSDQCFRMSEDSQVLWSSVDTHRLIQLCARGYLCCCCSW